MVVKYLFFDLECADGNYMICEFGYVVSDESFRVLERDNILMDPEGEFKLTGRYGAPDLKLSYDEEEYRRHPPFPEHYERIRKLLCDPGVIVFGYGVTNDVGFLAKDCRSYELEFFDFRCRNIQKYLGLTHLFPSKAISLEHAYETLCPDGDAFTEHRAEDDSYASMRVLEAIVKLTGRSVEELSSLVPSSNISSLAFMEERRLRQDERLMNQMRAERIARNRGIWANEAATTLMAKTGEKVYCSNGLFAMEDAFAQVLDKTRRGPFLPSMDFFKADVCLVADEEEKRSLSLVVKGKLACRIMTAEEFLG